MLIISIPLLLIIPGIEEEQNKLTPLNIFQYILIGII